MICHENDCVINILRQYALMSTRHKMTTTPHSTNMDADDSKENNIFSIQQTSDEVLIIISHDGNNISHFQIKSNSQIMIMEFDFKDIHHSRSIQFYKPINDQLISVEETQTNIIIRIPKSEKNVWQQIELEQPTKRSKYKKWGQVQFIDEEEEFCIGSEHFPTA
ncbi:hypothetical protein TRFO_02364 [Tritrichomonas foetus]|uniref:CS domain-containing protein n=1 Tax=Tritrichomonas foetus TaxID=1144522 RepID=A0A1J4J3A6_9EUKA|nr:hypothetical protein TRFO_02364 [Tritrichomonas foetus]|eukprot:OHS93842.1 hypothetical protein TRFO_02364 [Tritrichomonas foetus]